MRIAVISDVHGNASALEAVLADIDRHGVDAVLNLGDHFFGPLDPLRTAEMLAGREMMAIAGNCDRYLVEAQPEMLEEHDRRTLEGLDAPTKSWLAALPATAVFDNSVMLTHGTPASDEVYWLDRKERKQGFRPSTRDEIAQELPENRLPVYCCGHTHVARVVTLDDGTIVFNPGSVGRPSFTMSDPESAARLSPAAAYAMLERSAGHWHVNLRQIAYDNMAVSALARAHGSETWARDLAGGRER